MVCAMTSTSAERRNETADPGSVSRRIEAIDLARGLALVAMAVYHFSWDLEFFGYADPGMTTSGGWRIFARSIASSFLFLVGVSLYLAHANGIRWNGFGRRLAMVAGAAALISAATYLAMPATFIYFGILHHIAVASLLGLVFLRLPWPATLMAAVLVIAAPFWLTSQAFDTPLAWWTGLAVNRPPSNDYVPLLPWFGAVLLGIAAARLVHRIGLLDRLPRPGGGVVPRTLIWAGRHSLAVYLVHQPVLIALVWLASQIAPPPAIPRDIGFTRGCEAQCGERRDADFCSVYCVCVLDTLEAEGRFDEVYDGRPSSATSARLREIVDACSVEADLMTTPEEDTP
jgi:uncharacterized membrane protein